MDEGVTGAAGGRGDGPERRPEDVEETARAVLARLEELVTVARRIDARLQRREGPVWVPADGDPLPEELGIGRPRRAVLTRTVTEAGRREAAERAGAT